MKRLFYFICLNFFLLNSASAQQEWTLQQCIELALKNNIQVKLSELNTQQANVNYQQSWGNFIPSVNGNATNFYNFGRTIDRYTNQYVQSNAVRSNNLGLNTSVTLFNGLQNYNTLKQTELNLLAGKYDLDKARNDIALNVANAYLQILFNNEILAVAQNQVKLTAQQVERTKKLFEAGSLSKDNLLNIEAQKATEELNVVNAQNALDLSYLNLAQLLLLDNKQFETLKIQKPSFEVPENNQLVYTAEQIYQDALNTRPEVKSAEVKLKSADKSIKIAKGGLSPVLTLQGSYGTGYSSLRKDYTNPVLVDKTPIGFTQTGDLVYQPVYSFTEKSVSFGTQASQNASKSFGFNLSVPILNNLQVRSSIQRAKISQKNAQLNLEQTQNNLRLATQQAYFDASAAYKKYQANKKAIDASKESFKYTEQKFNVGMVNSFDYNNVKTRLMKAEADLIQAKFDYIFKLKILDFYQGKPITL